MILKRTSSCSLRSVGITYGGSKRSGRKETASLPEIYGMLPGVSFLSATEDNTSTCTIATVHKFHLQILVLFYFNPGSGFGQVLKTQKLPPQSAKLSDNFYQTILLDWQYIGSTFLYLLFILSKLFQRSSIFNF